MFIKCMQRKLKVYFVHCSPGLSLSYSKPCKEGRSLIVCQVTSPNSEIRN